jgi:AraC-like DNA-binding protein
MFQVIYLVDATEPFNFLIGPLFFLYISAKIDETRLKRVYYHFIPSLFYLFYSIFFHIKSTEYKYNSYLDQYHPELSRVFIPDGSFADPLILKSYVNELTIMSIAIYLLCSAIILYRAQRKNPEVPNRKRVFNILWVDVSFMTVILFIIVFVKVYYPHDLGDYIIIVAICIFIYAISFKVIRDSLFFKPPLIEKKYSKSALDEESKLRILKNLDEALKEKYYLNPSPSLPDLAKKINTSPNYLSQVINEKLNLTFLELINKYRIEEAKQLILDENLNETIEGIGYTVGFNSKSTFHSAFKKFTGLTPSEFKNSNRNM